ncbi:MAG TPA: xanthine dehydrogenase family protein molybdopterin-binding subunit [Dehalococcoidia bacterium]|nr:xanthine dehydrogenase family protein molybdopterin-binding subunit [Dehalococcoidia bacterium]
MAETHWVGARLKRKEDPALLAGRGRYIDDLQLPGMLHAAILASPYPHARIRGIDTSEALRIPGVVAVLTGRDAARMSLPSMSSVGVPTMGFCLAVGKARYAGEPVAAVVASDRYIAEDARELIRVEYEPLPAVVDPEAAMGPGAPLLYEEAGTNILWHRTFVYGNPEGAFKEAEHIVRERFYIHRYSSTPIETNGVVASYAPAEGTLTLWDTNHLPMVGAPYLALVLKLSPEKVRFIRGNIGGGFGNKGSAITSYEILASMLSMEVGRPVKWIADRQEDLTTVSSHGANLLTEAELALKGDGTIMGIKLKTVHDCGSFSRWPEPLSSVRMLYHCTGCYKVPNVVIDINMVATNKTPTGPNRGVGAYQFYFVLERMVDVAAKELGLDPAEIRLRNFIQPREMPYTTPNGNVYDSGNYPETLQRALEMLDYDEFRREQARLRREGRHLGLGLATVVESSTPNLAILGALTPPEARIRPLIFCAEAASVRLNPTGKAVVALGSVPQGQGHETVAAQIVADELGCHPDDITVLTGFDSATHPYTDSSGTYGDRFATAAVGAILGASRQVREKLLATAAHLLEAGPHELEIENGVVYVREAPEKAMAIDKIAFLAHNRSFPQHIDTSLEATYTYQVPFFQEPDPDYRSIRTDATFGNSAHAAVVEVDPETGQVQVRRYVVVHDCGKMLNPMVVEGQIHGGIAMGLGGSLYEEHIYDEKGQYLKGSFNDYLPPYATEVPEIEIEHLESPSPFSPLGEKGLGEGTGMATPAAIANAVEDALASFGVKVRRLPLTPQRVWSLVREAKGG